MPAIHFSIRFKRQLVSSQTLHFFSYRPSIVFGVNYPRSYRKVSISDRNYLSYGVIACSVLEFFRRCGSFILSPMTLSFAIAVTISTCAGAPVYQLLHYSLTKLSVTFGIQLLFRDDRLFYLVDNSEVNTHDNLLYVSCSHQALSWLFLLYKY